MYTLCVMELDNAVTVVHCDRKRLFYLSHVATYWQEPRLECKHLM